MERIFIVAAKRTAIGAFSGTLKDIPAGQLAAHAIKGALQAGSLSGDTIDEVIVGNVVSAGQGMGIGRQAAIYADIPTHVPAYSVNMVCGSGMKSIMDAVTHIRAGDAQLVVAAGVENMSQIPFAAAGNLRTGQKMGNFAMKDLLINDGLTDVYNQYHMGVTAENVAKKMDITREQQDQFALHSQQKAVAAIEDGRFKSEITPIEIKQRKQTITFDTDEYPTEDVTLEGLGKLRPAFDKEGSVTAGNASGINDGASAVILASESAVNQHGLIPLAEVSAYSQHGVDPSVMGLGPVGAVNTVLDKANLTLDNIDLFELNEAFAAQALGVVHQLAEHHKTTPDAILARANVNGGAIALGHPLGASGNRIVVTLLHELARRGETYGVASLCIGGGMGTALVIKRTQA